MFITEQCYCPKQWHPAFQWASISTLGESFDYPASIAMYCSL